MEEIKQEEPQEINKSKPKGQFRKYLLTLNNPEEKGYSPQTVIDKLTSLSSCHYACVALEIGLKELTPHLHAFVVYENAKAFSTMKNLIPEAHYDPCKGNAFQNRDYVFKTGKWKNSEKGLTAMPETQIEWGEMTSDSSNSDPEKELLLQLIEAGFTNAEIIRQYPQFLFDITNIDKCRLTLRQEQYANVNRFLEVTYIYGATGTGKSRGVLEKHGYANVFRVTDYLHPFDTYQGEEVLVFEEFASGIRIQDMLNYLDIYPLKLPARYSDKQACYTMVYIISNLPLEKQYPNIQSESSGTWKALLRRITKVVHYCAMDCRRHYDSTDSYFLNQPSWVERIVIDQQEQGKGEPNHEQTA